jgi:predicted alpha/beta superfamily hydrolase
MKNTGMLERQENFPSRFIAPRHVDVWLPDRYLENTTDRYPVVYMHDGQNLFASAIAYGGSGWEIDKAITRLMDTETIRGALVVGVWNTAQRWREYMPQEPYYALAMRRHQEAFLNTAGGEPVSDAYLKFLVEELKPFIDSRYRTLPQPPATIVMGSSMGGLISLYAISEYPEIFGSAGCLSTNWPVGQQELVQEMAKQLPDPQTHKLYFDYGTEGLDALYEPYQQHMDEHLRQAGYVKNENWITQKFPGANHSEKAWRERVEIPLSFFLSRMK